MTWRVQHGHGALVLALALLVLGANCDGGRTPQPPFLCCVLTCTGGLIRANKDAPSRVDAGWACERGQPMDYNGTCSAEDGNECEDPGASSQGMGSGGESSSSLTSSGGSSSGGASSASSM